MWMKDFDALHYIAIQWKRAVKGVTLAERQKDQLWERAKIDAYQEAAAAIMMEREEKKTGKMVMMPTPPQIVAALVALVGPVNPEEDAHERQDVRAQR